MAGIGFMLAIIISHRKLTKAMKTQQQLNEKANAVAKFVKSINEQIEQYVQQFHDECDKLDHNVYIGLDYSNDTFLFGTWNNPLKVLYAEKTLQSLRKYVKACIVRTALLNENSGIYTDIFRQSYGEIVNVSVDYYPRAKQGDGVYLMLAFQPYGTTETDEIVEQAITLEETDDDLSLNLQQFLVDYLADIEEKYTQLLIS
jgi:hypothetical protein